VDLTTRRLTAIALAVTVVATVYAVTPGDWIKAGVSLASVAACLLWGFWPDLLQKRGVPRVGCVSFSIQVTKAGYSQQVRAGQRVGVLRLTLLVAVHNDTDVAVTVRPTDPELVRSAPWRRTKVLPVVIEPEMAIDPMGRFADYAHFPEGQHTIPARSERSHYFFFKVVASDAGDEFLDRSLKLRVTIRLPGPHRTTTSLPPIAYL
jgi:hypothetical protein